MKINRCIEIEDIRHTDLHLHTVFCDGKNTPEEMVLAALQKGMTCIGFSAHSFVAFDSAAGTDAEAEKKYRKEIMRLKKAYDGRIRIYCGTELDYHSLPKPGTALYEEKTRWYQENYEYRIGSVHYLPVPAEYGPQYHPAAVDDTPEIFHDAVEQFYGGDYYRAAEAYFELEADVVQRTNCDIVGHFDLISKFNEKYRFFEEQHPAYRNAWQRAADRLLSTGKVFEINTGAVSRGWRTDAYPAAEIRQYIMKHGGRMVLSSDSHSVQTIGSGFSEYDFV